MTTLRARVLQPTSPTTVAWWSDAVFRLDGRTLAEVAPYDGRAVDADVRDGVVTPGFVDAHVHFPQTRIVGAASGPLLPWLRRSTFPEEARFADPAHAAAVAEAFTTALAAAGTTLAFIYSSVHPAAADALFSALDRRGLRAIAGPVLMDAGGPDALMLPADRALPALAALGDRWHGHDGRLAVAAIPRFGLSCSEALMRDAAALAADRGWWVSTHLAENPDECAATIARFHAPDYLSVYERVGLVHPRSVYAHCIHLSSNEWDRFARAGAVVAHCPDSNDFLGSGGMPIDAVLDRGIPLALGTDVAAGRTFRVPRIASSAHDNALRQGRRVPPEAWLWAATRGGAAALGQDHGGLCPGAPADLVLHDVPAWVDDADGALAWLLFHHDAPPVRRTWVAGRVVWDRAAWAARGAGLVWA